MAIVTRIKFLFLTLQANESKPLQYCYLFADAAVATVAESVPEGRVHLMPI